MNRYRLLAVVFAVAVVLSGCSRKGGPVPDPGRGAAAQSDFCKAVVQFRVDSAPLNAGLSGDAPTAARDMSAAHDDLVKLLTTQMPTDIKADVQLISDTYGNIATNLANVKAGDLTGYLAAVSKGEPNTKAVDAAARALDVYVPTQCGLTTSPDLTTTTTGPTTTVAPTPAGPVLPSTSTSTTG